jgi:MFS family permease
MEAWLLVTKLRLGTNGYWQRIQEFTPNARLLILSNVTRSFGGGVSSTIFNLYLLSLGYSKTFLGGFLALNAFVMSFACLVVGPYVTRVGTKNAIILACLINVVVAIPQVAYPVVPVLLMTQALGGLQAALMTVASGPFIAENSTAHERTHLFGASQSFSIVSSFAGNLFAGYLPGWLALALVLPQDSAPSFQLALIAYVIPLIIGILPLFFVRTPESLKPLVGRRTIGADERVVPEPKGSKAVVSQFVLVNLLIGLGAGFVVPYFTVIFWEFYDLPTHVIGIVQGMSSLTMAAGIFLSPALSTRIGKVWTVVVCQAISLPFLVTIAIIVDPFVAIACYVLRNMMMNAATPVDNALRMEMVPKNWRANMSAVTGFAWNLPWSLSTQVTGPLLDQGQYLLPFWFTFTSYAVSTILYGFFFRGAERKVVPKRASQKPVVYHMGPVVGRRLLGR